MNLPMGVSVLLLVFMLGYFIRAIGTFGRWHQLGVNEYHPTQAADLTPQVWASEIEPAVYEKQRVVPWFKKLEKSGEQINVRKFGTLGRTTPANNVALLGLSYSVGADSAVTATPITSYVAVALNLNTVARMIQDPTNQFRMACEASVAEGVDVEGCKLIDDLTTIVGGVGQNVTEATFLDASVSVDEAVKNNVEPGSDFVFVFHTRQKDDVIASTQNWSQFQITGRPDSPVTSGQLKAAYGYKFVQTGNVQNIGALFHNGLFVRGMTFGIGYNQPPDVLIQERDIARLVICWTDFVVITIWSDRGADYQTTTIV